MMKNYSSEGPHGGLVKPTPVRVSAWAFCAALVGGSGVAYADTSLSLPTQPATVIGAAAPPSDHAASTDEIASMVSTLQKQIIEQQAMLQVLQKRLSSNDAMLSSVPAAPVTLSPPTPTTVTAAAVPPVTTLPVTSDLSARTAPPTEGASSFVVGQPVVDEAPLTQAVQPVQATVNPTRGTVVSSQPAVTAGQSVPQSAPSVGAATSGASGVVVLTTDAQRQAYASGVTVWSEIENSISSQRGLGIQLDERYVMAGLQDMAEGHSLKMSPDDVAHMMNQLNGDYIQRANDAKAHQEAEGKAYRIAFSKESGAYSDAGAWYKITDKGQGRHLRTTDLVELSVVGRLPDGSVFDASGQQGQTKTVKVGVLLPSVAIGLQKVSPGGRLTVVVPPGKGYGDVGMPPSIPGGATLIFDISVKGLAEKR